MGLAVGAPCVDTLAAACIGEVRVVSTLVPVFAAVVVLKQLHEDDCTCGGLDELAVVPDGDQSGESDIDWEQQRGV